MCCWKTLERELFSQFQYSNWTRSLTNFKRVCRKRNMKVTMQPSTLSGSILAAASKSSMQRACAAALVSKGTSIVHNPGHSNDDKAALDIVKRLGAEWSIDGEELTIKSNGVKPISDEINCGESG